MSVLVCKDVNKVYPGDVHAVKNFNIDIEQGEFIVLVGPSGCGKSTLIRMIAGLEGISTGDLIIEDEKVNHLAPADRDIAMVFQNYALYGNMTVYENMAFSMIVRHKGSDEIHEKVMKAAEVVNLTELLLRKPANLSGGQSQRVALGRAMVRDANIFLLDEPLSNLDAKLRGETRIELKMLHDQLGSTFIYVTHDQVEAMTMADRIVVLKDGIVQQIGTPTEVYNTPANMFVGGFIGSPPINFIEGSVKSGRFVSEDMSFDIPSSHKATLAREGKKVVLGIRAEAFDYEAKSTKEHHTMKFTADTVELLGADENIYFYVNGQQTIAKIKCGTKRVKQGDQLKLTFDLEDIHFFDAETEMRIY